MALRRALTIITVLAAAAFLFWVCFFKVQDSDFWWHVKAGELYLTQGWITLDPFAYTREGLPYVATHEWLGQVVFALLFQTFGAAGIIALRFASLLAIAGLILSLDWKRLWPNAVLIMGAAIVMRQGLIERPQLITNVFFALSIVAGLNLLDADDQRVRLRWGIVLVIAQILWVNIHGGAAFLALIVPAALFVQTLIDRRVIDAFKYPVILGALLLAAMLVSPNGLSNLTYVWLLFTDQTAEFIEEWSPHSWNQYVSQFGLLVLVSIAALIWTRRRFAGACVLLLAPLILSRTGSRHEVLFVIAALAATVYQLKWNDWWQERLDTKLERPLIPVIATVCAIALILLVDMPYRSFIDRSDLRGVGTVEKGKGAYEFLERTDVSGEIFNTYSLGGYLLYRGSPKRTVFIDGRNVDYGYAFMKAALDARTNKTVFDELQQEYGFTIAVIEYAANSEPDAALDFTYLESHPDWALVHIDDHVAVYVLRTPEHEPLIAEKQYRVLTPTSFFHQTVLETLQSSDVPQLTKELVQSAESSSDDIRALVLLSMLQTSLGHPDQGFAFAQEALKRKAGRYEPYLAGAVALKAAGQEADADGWYADALARARHAGVTLRPEL